MVQLPNADNVTELPDTLHTPAEVYVTVNPDDAVALSVIGDSVIDLFGIGEKLIV